MRCWIWRGVIGIVRDELRLYYIVERHGLDIGLLLEARRERTQQRSARVGEVQLLIGGRLYERELLLAPGQSELIPGVDRRRRVSMGASAHDGTEALDAMITADDVKRRQPCRCGIHLPGGDLQVCAGLGGKLHKHGIGYEPRLLAGVVGAGARSTGRWPNVYYCKGKCG